MSKFFYDTMQGLLEVVAIKNGEIKMKEVPNLSAKTQRVVHASKLKKYYVDSFRERKKETEQ